MALPTSGPISLNDMNTDRGIASGTQIDLASAGTAYSVSYTTNGSNDLQFLEFYGKSILGAFSFAAWNGSVSVNLNGVVSYVTGNATAVSVSPTTFALVSTDTTQTINVTITVPSGYSNSGGTVSGTKTAVQPAKLFAYADWVSSGGSLSINRNNGNVSYTNGTLGTVSSISPTSFDLVTSTTSRNVTVNVTAPSGYANSGNTLTGTYTVSQAATDETISITLNGSTNTWSPSGQGASTTLSVDVVNIWNTSWTVLSDSDWLSVVSSTGTGDGTRTIIAGANYVGQTGYTGNTRSGVITVYKTSDFGIRATISVSQQVGVAPVVAPTVSLTAPNGALIGYNEYGNQFNYKLYQGTWTGGSTPTQGSFSMNGGGNFAFVSTDGNVVITEPSNGFWVGTIQNATSSPYSVGVYALSANSSTTSERNATITFSLGNTGGSNSTSLQIRQQVAPPIFAFSDWNGSVSVSQGGSVSYVTGNAAGAVLVSPSSFGLVNTDTTRTINVTITVPSGYSNSGGTVSGTRTATQASVPTFSFGDAGVSGFAVSQNGTITPPTALYASISSITYNGSISNTSYGLVNTTTTRDATVYVTVPNGYYNSGEEIGGTVYANQSATATFYFGDWTGGISINENGQVSATSGNSPSVVSLSPANFDKVYTPTDRNVTVGVSVPGGYYNSGGNVFGNKTATQPAAPADPTVTVYTRCDTYAVYFIEGEYSYSFIDILGATAVRSETTTRSVALASSYTELFYIYESINTC
jgi:hypothetical protein